MNYGLSSTGSLSILCNKAKYLVRLFGFCESNMITYGINEPIMLNLSMWCKISNMVEWEVDLRNAGIQLVRQRAEWADLGVAPDLDTTVGMTNFMRDHFDRANAEMDSLAAMFGLSGRVKTEAEFMGSMDAMIKKCERVPIFEQTFREWPRG